MSPGACDISETMSLLSLPPELIEEIALYLRPKDLAALMLSCRWFHDVVDDSLLLQYIYRTGLAGVCDPLYNLSLYSIPDRMRSLRRWEDSWANLERYLVAPQLVISADRDRYGQCFLSNDYLFSVNTLSDSEGVHPPALAYIDMRDVLLTGQHLWKRIDYPRGSEWVTQTFSIEKDDLVVCALQFPPNENVPWKTALMLKFMSFKTGGTHPLAKEPHIQLDTELNLTILNVHMDIIGDQIMLVLANLRNEEGVESDEIYLVDWKQGRITLVHSAPNGTYEGAIAVLSSDLVLLLRRDPTSIELCRVTDPSSSSRGGSSSGKVGTSTPSPEAIPSLHVVCTLALPAFDQQHMGMAYMQTDRHTECMCEPEVSSQEQEQEPVWTMRTPAPLPFHGAPEDMIVVITFIMASFVTSDVKKFVMTVSHRALFALAAKGPPPDGYHQGLDSSCSDGTCGGKLEGEGNRTVEQKQEQVIIPWEEWGPQATSIIVPSSTPWMTACAGQRWLSLESDKLVIRDFSATRVRSARAHSRSHREHVSAHICGDNDERGEQGAAAKTETIIPAGQGSCFREDVVSSLPFLETQIDVPEGASDSILTDGKRLVIFVHWNVEPVTFNVHVLEDGKFLTEKASCVIL